MASLIPILQSYSVEVLEIAFAATEPRINVDTLILYDLVEKMSSQMWQCVPFRIRLCDGSLPPIDLVRTATEGVICASSSHLERLRIPRLVVLCSRHITCLSFKGLILDYATVLEILELRNLRRLCFHDLWLVADTIHPYQWATVWRDANEEWTEVIELDIENCGYTNSTVVTTAPDDGSWLVVSIAYRSIPNSYVAPEITEHDALELDCFRSAVQKRMVTQTITS
jgi:hypothetical protein